MKWIYYRVFPRGISPDTFAWAVAIENEKDSVQFTCYSERQASYLCYILNQINPAVSLYVKP